MSPRTIRLSSQDVATCQRLLSILTDPAPGPAEVRSDRLRVLARFMLAQRKRRTDYLHPAMLGEPAYDMLLGLYIAEEEESPVTATRLGEIAGVAQSSALRWIEYLIGKELISREPHPNHKRASMLTLSSKGRAALEGVFQAIFEGMEELRA